ncbi:MAG: prepilin-type N-terminal cleavage/methylation domain-containing protein, partial [Campylobacter sp.]|nr:prepilin-type N-terminal cleavage/methylation domain-containing protein [Campylobacter sp.]MBZ8004329.1 prepilin-type N-terminal cleavage/methylation domain-containing protein [Campylobacter canadensis]
MKKGFTMIELIFVIVI